MNQLTAMSLTIIAGLVIFALVNWVAMIPGKRMGFCRQVVLYLASVPLSLLTMWWAANQLEEYMRTSFVTPNV